MVLIFLTLLGQKKIADSLTKELMHQ